MVLDIPLLYLTNPNEAFYGMRLFLGFCLDCTVNLSPPYYLNTYYMRLNAFLSFLCIKVALSFCARLPSKVLECFHELNREDSSNSFPCMFLSLFMFSYIFGLFLPPGNLHKTFLILWLGG